MKRNRRTRGRLVVAALVALPLLAIGAGAAALGVFSAASAPANDLFVDATAVDQVIAGTTVGATADVDEVVAGVANAEQPVVWYVWHAEVSGWTYLTPASAENPTMPTVKAYLGDAIGGLEQVDQAPTGSGSGGVSIPAVAGHDYHLAVVGTAGGEAFELAVAQPAAIGAVNDRPDGAIDAGSTVAKATETNAPQVIAVDTVGGATADVGEAPTHGLAAEHSLWYSWTPTTSGGSMTFTADPMFGAPGPIRVAVYTAVDADGTPGLGVDDLTPAPGGEQGGPVVVEGGTTYLISVDGPESFFRLTVTSTGVTANDDTTPPVVHCDPAPAGWTDAAELAIACTASDEGSGLAQDADTSFTLAVETTSDAESDTVVIAARSVCDQSGNCATVGPFSGLRVDRKAPVVNCGALDPAWSFEAPSVTCTATDGGSGLADPADATRILSGSVSPDTEAQIDIATVDICDGVGNCTTVGPFGPTGVDTKAPTITCDAPPVGPSSTQVTIDCTATDGGSGLAEPTSDSFTLSTSVGAGEATGTATTDSREVCDVVGNCVTAGPFGGLVVDLAPPAVICAPDDGLPVDDWRAGPFSITCTVTDVGTGLVPGTPETLVLSATLADGEVSASVTAVSALVEVCDRAGSCVPVGPITGLRIDRQAPKTYCPPAGDGWARTSATISCSVEDGDGSGLDSVGSVALGATAPVGEEGMYSTDTVEVCDRVGNCATAGPVQDLKVDDRAPTVHCDAPADDYQVEARIRCTATDGGSGLADSSDASFVLSSSVGEGNRDDAALTSSREVCDVVGLCFTAGPIQASVDLSGPGGNGPAMALPSRVSVLSAYTPVGPTAVPYAVPLVPGADEVACRARPGAMFVLGWSRVVCEAINARGDSQGSFPLVVKVLPELAPTAGAVPGGAWRAVGVGFAPGSDVVVEINRDVVARGAAGADGRVSIELTIPADLPSGDHQLVVRGLDGAGDPMLNVGPLAAVERLPGTIAPVDPPAGAPVLPSQGPEVPPDPGPAPAAPDLGDLAPLVTTTTTTPTSATTIELPPAGGELAAEPGDSGADGTGSTEAGEPGAEDGFVFGHLPRTGADLASWLGLAFVLIATGILLTRLRRASGR